MRKFAASALAALSLNFAAPALAADLIVDSSTGKLTGATGVNVNGTLYDVAFVEGTCLSVYGSCDPSLQTFTDYSGAQAAALALLDQVFIETFDADPTLTVGCETAPAFCQAFIPYTRYLDGLSGLTALNSGTGADSIGAFDFTSGNDTSFWNNAVYARFTLSPSGVPEPATWALMLLGFGAIGTVVRTSVRRSSSSQVGATTPSL